MKGAARQSERGGGGEEPRREAQRERARSEGERHTERGRGAKERRREGPRERRREAQRDRNRPTCGKAYRENRKGMGVKKRAGETTCKKKTERENT